MSQVTRSLYIRLLVHIINEANQRFPTPTQVKCHLSLTENKINECPRNVCSV